MAETDLERLGALIKQEQTTLLARWRLQARELPSAKGLDVPALNDHIPVLLDELALALESPADLTIAQVVTDGQARAHGLQRLQNDFQIEEVVAEYNILRDCLHELADENGLMLRGQLIRLVNGVLDAAIGAALKAYSNQRDSEVLERREEYLAFVAHDLRTPLSAIVVAAQVLERQLPIGTPPSQTNHMVKTLRRNAQRLEDLVTKVLEQNNQCEAAIGFTLQRRQIDLWPLAEELLQDLQPLAATARMHLVNQVPHDLVTFADASALRRVLQNLVHNAIRHSQGREVQIGANTLPDESGIECWVKDDGVGISEQLLERIFDTGQTDPGSTAGSGLGLAIVKRFTEAAGGAVTVQSQAGAGSIFRFTLPTQPPPP
jgi:two-component system, OmpR family, phosphate regulon sensor histidine kinase PhoR